MRPFWIPTGLPPPSPPKLGWLRADVMSSLPIFAGTNQSVCNELLVGQQPLLLARWGELEQDMYQGLVQLFIRTSPFVIVGLVQM